LHHNKRQDEPTKPLKNAGLLFSSIFNKVVTNGDKVPSPG